MFGFLPDDGAGDCARGKDAHQRKAERSKDEF